MRAGRIGSLHLLQAGLSLVEVLVALVIGLVVIGAVMVNYLGTGFTGRSSSALAQVTEDASVALNVIRSHVALAGYGRPIQFDAGTARLQLTLGAGRKVFGCDNSFSAADVGTLQELTCANGNGNDAIAVLYEADESNSVTVQVAGVDRRADCIGSGIAPTPAAGAVPQYFRAEARFYVNNDGTLLCQGNGGNALAVAGASLGTGPQPLAENIQTLQIRYGLSADVQEVPGLPERPGQRVTRYVDASDIALPAQWNNVRAIRVCVVARSEAEVLDEVTPYFGCFAAGPNDLIVPNDRRIYRAFTTTIMLQNRF